jgi:hypothetical protein
MTVRHPISTDFSEARSLDSLCRELISALTGLLAEPAATAGWRRARTMLAALPLTTSEYAVSVNRLTSAEIYASCRELGAARFELAQLSRKLATITAGVPVARSGGELGAVSA